MDLNFSFNQERNQFEATITAKLVSVAKEPRANATTGKMYYPCSIKFVDNNGQEFTSIAVIPAANYAYGMEVGAEYQTRAIVNKGQENVFFQMSHLQGTSERVSAGNLFAELSAKVAAESLITK